MTTNSKVTVHYEGQEGSIEIDALTGQVLTTPDDRPEWATGLLLALVGERTTYYFGGEVGSPSGERVQVKARLDRNVNEQAIMTDVVDYRDFGWIGMTDEGEQVEIEADNEYRMGRVAEVMGLDREDYDAMLAGSEAAGETRTQAETEALTGAQLEGFGGKAQEQKAATAS